MLNVKMVQPVKVVCADDLGQTLTEICQKEHYERPLVVTDSFVGSMALVAGAIAALESAGIHVALFDKVKSDPLSGTVDAGVAAFTDHHADSIIAIGGGSSMDVARGINIVRVNGGSIIDYTDPAKPIAHCGGMIAVPTTAGTGSEMSNALVFTDERTNQKLAVLADPATSEYAVLNADLMLTLPPKMTIACGLDAFCHAAEGYLSNLASPITDAICEKVMFLLYNYLPRAVANGQDREARERVMVASTLAGWMLNNAGTIVGHSMAHVLGAKYHIVHGEAVGYALPAVMEFVAPARAKKVREIGQILGAVFPQNAPVEQTAIIAARAFKDFRDRMIGLHPFTDYGISADEIVSNAQAVVDERFAGNTPRGIDLAAAKQLLLEFGQR